ncbi:MAG: aroA [Acidimicrobiaceae bacterium]|nr:MAG: aroA [Acidimicrobiaceae bacterium]
MSEPGPAIHRPAIHRVHPATAPLSAEVHVPGSKSVSNRALVCAALAEGTSELDGVAPGDDTAAMLDCLQRLGVGIGAASHSHSQSLSGSLSVHGCGELLLSESAGPAPVVLATRLAGTTSRFVTALAALGRRPITVDGLPPLRARPMTPLHDALQSMGGTVEPGERWGHLPVTVRGPLAPVDGAVSIRGDVSSQYITALMLIAPYIAGGLRIRLTTPLVSRSYLGVTAAVMAAFGVDEVDIGEHEVVVPEGRYLPTAYRATRWLPPPSSAARFASPVSRGRRCRAMPASPLCWARWAATS